MKALKRLIAIAACAVIAAGTFTGCGFIFENIGTSGGCQHELHLATKEGDNEYHYIKCVWCAYTETYPHEFDKWSESTDKSVRNCKVCHYTDVCMHENQTYIISDTEHYAVCDYCNHSFEYWKKEHEYDQYIDVTETTHSTSCVCGKTETVNVGHTLNYEYNLIYGRNQHWQKCECGYETEKEDCTYGKYTVDETMHYAECLTCGKGVSDKHRCTLTEDRVRKCAACGFIEEPYTIFLGTWKYMGPGSERFLTLYKNWSYVIEDVAGKVYSRGDYYISDYSWDSGYITGYLILSADSLVRFKFESGKYGQFKNNYETYTKV